MAKSAAERKAAQRARQAAAGGRKFELILDTQELEMLAQLAGSAKPALTRAKSFLRCTPSGKMAASPRRWN